MSELGAASPEVEELYWLKEEFRRWFQTDIDRETVYDLFDTWAQQIKPEYKELQTFIRTVHQWQEEIFNYFAYPWTNGYAEAANGVIDRLSNAGRGYSFEVLRGKALYYIKPATRQKITPITQDHFFYNGKDDCFFREFEVFFKGRQHIGCIGLGRRFKRY